MGRSSRLTLFVMGIAILPTAATAQFYGFPSEIGVADDGFGVLPPVPSAAPAVRPIGDEAAVPYPPFPPLRSPPPACPLVIKIGRGLHQPAQTRVVYGRPACS